MIFNLKNKGVSLLAFTLITLTGTAQEFKTDVSVRDQFKNNSVPGLKYAAPETQKVKPATIKPYEGSSLAHELKTGTAVNAKFAAGTGTAAVKATAATTSPTIALPSDMTPEQAKAANEKDSTKTIAPAPLLQEQTKPVTEEAPKKQAAPVKVPSQEENKKSNGSSN